MRTFSVRYSERQRRNVIVRAEDATEAGRIVAARFPDAYDIAVSRVPDAPPALHVPGWAQRMLAWWS